MSTELDEAFVTIGELLRLLAKGAYVELMDDYQFIEAESTIHYSGGRVYQIDERFCHSGIRVRVDLSHLDRWVREGDGEKNEWIVAR